MTLSVASALKERIDPARETREETTAMTTRRPKRRAVMVSAVLTQLMIVLDLTIIAIALPRMQDDLGMTLSESPWTVTGYSLAFGGWCSSGEDSVPWRASAARTRRDCSASGSPAWWPGWRHPSRCC